MSAPKEPEQWDFFLSHKQADMGRAVALLEGDLRERKYKSWLDVKMKDCSVPAMMHGVEHSRFFVLVLSEHYFESDYCKMELFKAIELGKPVVLTHREGLDVGTALRLMKEALLGTSEEMDRAVAGIVRCTSIQLVVSDADFARMTVSKILEAAGLERASSAVAQANLRHRVRAIASSLQIDVEHRHMAGVLERAMETLCIRPTAASKPLAFHERVHMIEQHLGL